MNFQHHNIYIKVQDHSVSNEKFELLIDEEYQLLKTHPQPALENLFKYYESNDYISHTDAKKSMFEKVYQFVKTYSLYKKVKLINLINPNKGQLLDIGAGTADFLIYAKNNGWNVTGVEPSQKARNSAIAKGIALEEKWENINNQKYDVITMWHVLEHVPDVIQQIKNLKEILKPNGTIIIAVPNFKSYDAQYYNSYWAAYDVPRHLWHFSRTAIQKLFETQQMIVTKTIPLPFDSYYVSLLSEKYKNGKMNPFKAFWMGFKSNYKARKTSEYSSIIYLIKNNTKTP